MQSSHLPQQRVRLVEFEGISTGPLAQTAGHDLNGVALTGLLSLAAPGCRVPILPPAVVGDADETSPFHDLPFYAAYACADGGFINLAALGPPFYALLLAKSALDDVDLASQYDKATWPELKASIATLGRSRPRAAWCALREGSEVCCAAMRSMGVAAQHPHNTARGTYRQIGPGPIEVAAAPRFTTINPNQQETTT